MSYVKHVNTKSPEYLPLVNAIQSIKNEVDRDPELHDSIDAIRILIYKRYNVSIDLYNKTGYHNVDFGDEKNYTLFLLRWS